MHGVNDASSIFVPTTTLDKELETAMPDFVKIDVEGAELLVLKGGQKLFQEQAPILILEVKKENLQDALQIILKYYDDIFAIGDLREPLIKTA